MAVKTIEELKSYFESGDFPDQSQFEDLIDSCYNNPVSGDVVFNDNLTVDGDFYCENIILSDALGDEYRLTVTTDGILSAVSLNS
jgi:hypothetical protein